MPRKKIQDEFTKLRVSPQRKWQLRRKRDGKCEICGKPNATADRCLKHAIYFREWQRKAQGYKRRNKSKTYVLQALRKAA